MNKSKLNNGISLLDDELEVQKITVYPNPFIDHISLDLNNIGTGNKNLRLQLTDITGKVLKVKDFVLDGSVDNLMLSLQDINLQPGVYLLRTTGDKIKTETFKIIKR